MENRENQLQKIEFWETPVIDSTENTRVKRTHETYISNKSIFLTLKGLTKVFEYVAVNADSQKLQRAMVRSKELWFAITDKWYQKHKDVSYGVNNVEHPDILDSMDNVRRCAFKENPNNMTISDISKPCRVSS